MLGDNSYEHGSEQVALVLFVSSVAPWDSVSQAALGLPLKSHFISLLTHCKSLQTIFFDMITSLLHFCFANLSNLTACLPTRADNLVYNRSTPPMSTVSCKMQKALPAERS